MHTLCHYTSFLLEGKKKESLNACADWWSSPRGHVFQSLFKKTQFNLVFWYFISVPALFCDRFGPIPNALSSVGPSVAWRHIDCWVVCGLCHLKQSHRYPAGLAFSSYQSRRSEGFWELRLSDHGSQTLRHTPMTSGSGSGRCHSGTHWPYMQDTLQRWIQTDEISNNTVKSNLLKHDFCSNGHQNSFTEVLFSLHFI